MAACLGPTFDGFVRRGGIERIPAGDNLQQVGRFTVGPGHGADLVEGAGVGDISIARNPPVGWFQADTSAKRGRLADRPAGILGKRERAFTRDHTGRRTAAGPTGDRLVPPRIAAWPEPRGLCRRSHGEFVDIGFANDNRVSRLNLPDRRSIVRWNVLCQHPRAA